MAGKGLALMGTGRASGPTRALDAAEMAVSSPLLEDVSIDGATGILINVTGGYDMTLREINEAASLIEEAADEDAHIIFGNVIDEDIRDEIKITVIATGFETANAAKAKPAMAAATIEPEREEAPPAPVRTSRRELRSTINGMPAAEEADQETVTDEIPRRQPAKENPQEERRASFIRSPTGSVRHAGGGLSPTEEEQMDVPTFLRNPKRSKES